MLFRSIGAPRTGILWNPHLTPELCAWGATPNAVVERFSAVGSVVYPSDAILDREEAPSRTRAALNGSSPIAALLAAHPEAAEARHPAVVVYQSLGSVRWLHGRAHARATSRVASWNGWLRLTALFQIRGFTVWRNP